MKKVLLIAHSKSDTTLSKSEAFAHKVQGLLGGDVQVEYCDLAELVFEASPDKLVIYHPSKGFDVRDFDLVIMRHIGSLEAEAHAVTLYCEYFDIKYTDTYLNRRLLNNKMSTQFLLWVSGLAHMIPHTLYGPTAELISRLPDIGELAIFKDNIGTKGRLNFVVHGGEDIGRIVHENPDTRFILQQFIPNTGDLRVLVLGGKPALVIKRTGDGSTHLNNTSQGGSAEVLPVDSIDTRLIEDSVRAAEVTGLQVAGVDLVTDTDTGQSYFLEINNAPQVSSGSFVDEKAAVYTDMIKRFLDL